MKQQIQHNQSTTSDIEFENCARSSVGRETHARHPFGVALILKRVLNHTKPRLINEKNASPLGIRQ
jgi:hypothetical protein